MSKFKVGDRVRDPCNDLATVVEVDGEGKVRVRWDAFGESFHFLPPGKLQLVKSANTSPVRVKTVKEIVPGVYGRVVVEGETYKRGSTGERQLAIDFAPRNSGGVMPTLRHCLTATELREAARVFEQLAEAIEDE